MKSLMFFLAIFFVAFLISNDIDAQEKSQRATQGWFESSYWTPVVCDGELVDVLEGGTLRVHYVYRYKNGAFMKQIVQLKGEVTSSTGEVFQISERDLYYPTEGTILITWKYNLRGNWGTHYIGEVTQDYFSGEITIGKTVCPGSDMED